MLRQHPGPAFGRGTVGAVREPPLPQGRQKLISEITGEVLYDRIERQSLLVRVSSLCYEVFVPSGIASRLRTAPATERHNPLTFYTIYYIDGGLGGGHLTPRLVGFLDPLDREFFETFTTVPGVGFMRALKCLVRPLNEIALAIERGDTEFPEGAALYRRQNRRAHRDRVAR